MKGHVLGSGLGLVKKLVAGGLLLVCMSGCAAIGPLLTLGGTWITPLQYASTAYTVGEFTYEYAENGKTPDEVIEAKLDSISDVFDGEDEVPAVEEGPAPVVLADAESERMETFLSMSRKDRAQRRIEMRRVQMERLEMRKMAFLQAKEKDISLRGGHVRALDLSNGADGDVSLFN
ncbi:hypothetical protein [Salidesulfovibrio onnuriiensis]|uniref:hypothetical protein n=1 Tax=Salidesulfovibrio onnuriiensis TaxID=2583823 RepID=UPI0011C7C1DA|nr:hypothetical protein [Salidesulfovibrio onnuriiensis]